MTRSVKDLALEFGGIFCFVGIAGYETVALLPRIVTFILCVGMISRSTGGVSFDLILSKLNQDNFHPNGLTKIRRLHGNLLNFIYGV